jgi:DNA uptake protein ComE-like DNA-binding protein
MDEDKMRKIMKEVVDEAITPINQRLGTIEEKLNDQESGLSSLRESVDANTASVVELEKTINGYGDMYKMNNDNIIKLGKRMTTVEDELAINPPEELLLGEVR